MQVPSFTALPLVEGGRWRLLWSGSSAALHSPEGMGRERSGSRSADGAPCIIRETTITTQSLCDRQSCHPPSNSDTRLVQTQAFDLQSNKHA